MILALSFLQVFLITILLFMQFSGAFYSYYLMVFIAVISNSFLLLAFGLNIFQKLPLLVKNSNDLNKLAIHSQFLLHFVILTILLVEQFYGLGYKAMLGLSPILHIFFLTAIVTWNTCYKLFNSKIYNLFVTGSKALLAWSLLLSLLGIFYEETFLTNNLYFLFILYFTVHFIELGFVLLKIKSDINTLPPSG